MPSSLRQDVIVSLKTIITMFCVRLNSYTDSPQSQTSQAITSALLAGFAILHSISSENEEDEDNFDQLTQDLLLQAFCFLSSLDQSRKKNLSISTKGEREVSEAAVLAFLSALDQAHHLRYLAPRIPRLMRRERKVLCFEEWFQDDEHTWATAARMSKKDFITLLHLIGNDKIFQNRSNNPQAPVEWQLLVALANFGLSGNGGSCPMKAKLFASAEGSIENYTNRCIVAILKLGPRYIKWPTSDERKQIKKEIGSSSFFKDCVGFIDGTLIPLAVGPKKNKEDYQSRKGFYAMNSLIICDHQRRILYAHHGWCGSAHDQQVLKNSEFFRRIEDFFSPGEYILADSGYTSSARIVPAFKKPRKKELPRAQRYFNYALSLIRVASEHTNGLVKGRFQSLRECRLVIHDEASVYRFTAWASAVCILHNFLLAENRDWGVGLAKGWQDHVEPIPSEQEEQEANVGNNTGNPQRRDDLFSQFLCTEMT